jgi:hypothetical protein
MQYPQFQQKGWPLGSGMVESAQKNVVEARWQRGRECDFQRKNVNPMLALRNAVCNDRWREMWQKAVGQHQKQQAQKRSIRVKLRAQARLAVGQSSSSFSAQPTTVRESLSAPPQERAQCCPQRSEEMGVDVCICGNPLVRLSDGSQMKRYCSQRCSNRARKRAQRERDKQRRASLAPPKQIAQSAQVLTRHAHQRALKTAPPHGSQPKAQPPKIHKTSRTQPPVSSQEAGEVSKHVCMCGASFTPLVRGQVKRYCSHRCRQRAYRQR